MRKLTSFGLIVTLSATALSQGGGPMGYYMTAGDAKTNVRYDNGALTTFATSGGSDYPIAVSGDVRTAASGQNSGDHGGQYDLNGNWTGVDYAGFAFNPSFDMLFYDGTTDGTNHFVVNYGNVGGVWSTDRNWNNVTKLFDLGGFGERLGITYDDKGKTLWTSHWDSGVVEEWSMSGSLLRSWDSGLGGRLTSLAMDPTTGFLWMGRQSAQGFFYAYDRDGNRVGSFFDSTLQSLNTLGGEFNIVPEPVSIVAFGTALLAVARRRNRK